MFGTTSVGAACERRGHILQVGAGRRKVGRIDGRVVVGAGAGQNLAPLFVPEEERLLLVGVVHVRNEDRAADVEAEDVVVDVGHAE